MRTRVLISLIGLLGFAALEARAVDQAYLDQNKKKKAKKDKAKKAKKPPGEPDASPLLVDAQVVTRTSPKAKVCVIHVHGNEQSAARVADWARGYYCANQVDVVPSPNDRYLLAGPKGKRCKVDPNRIFTPAGLKTDAFKDNTCKWVSAVAPEVVRWRDQKLIPAIARCRGGKSGLKGPLPVLALHNNTSTSTNSFTKSDAPKRSIKDSADEQRLHNFFLVTQEKDYKLSNLKGYNVLLQGPAVRDDGSLSVAMAQVGGRYVVIETYGINDKDSETLEKQMTSAAMASFGVQVCGSTNKKSQQMQ
jgi:hypothetical protein